MGKGASNHRLLAEDDEMFGKDTGTSFVLSVVQGDVAAEGNVNFCLV